MSPSSPRTARAGFTLIELMVAIAILAILIGIAAPGLRDFVLNTRLTGQANDLLTDLMLARSEAVKRDVSITICGKKASIDTACGTDADWGGGWIVVVDADGDGKQDSGSNTLLKAAEAVSTKLTLTNKSIGKPGVITFAPTGSAVSLDTTLRLCDERNQGRIINVGRQGRAWITQVLTGCKT